MKALEELLELIKDSKEISRFKRLEAIIENDDVLKAKIGKLKAVQKQMINAEHIEKKVAYEQFKAQYDAEMEALYEYPLLSEYLALQGDINHMLKEITSILEDGINEDVNK